MFLIVTSAAIAPGLWVWWPLEGGAGALQRSRPQVSQGVQKRDAMVINLCDGDPGRSLPDNYRAVSTDVAGQFFNNLGEVRAALR